MKYQYNTQEEYEPNNTFWNVISSPYPVALIFTLSFILLMACSVSFYMFFFFYPKTSIDFLVMGDYGGFGNENQTLVAKNMGVWCSNNPCDFIVTTGDNFYPNGTSSFDDPHFKGSFEDVYSHPSLLNLTWYTVLGNHDWKGMKLFQIIFKDGHIHKLHTQRTKRLQDGLCQAFIIMLHILKKDYLIKLV